MGFFVNLHALTLCVSGVTSCSQPPNREKYQVSAYVIVMNEMPTTPQQNKILGIPTSKQITKLYNIQTNRETRRVIILFP